MITELTKEQRNKIPGYVKKKVAEALAYRKLTPELAREVAEATYQLIDKPIPDIIICVGSLAEAHEKLCELTGNDASISVIDPYLKGQFDADYFGWVDFYIDEMGFKIDEDLQKEYELYKKTTMFGPVYPLDDFCIVCERLEEVHLNERGLHNETGYAVKYPNGWKKYFLNGVLVPETVVTTDPKDMTKEWLQEHFIKETNTEVRSEIANKLGTDLLCSRLDSTVIDEDAKMYQLIELDIGDGVRRPYLKMINASLPDMYHIEGVSPEIKTVYDALLWRNGIAKDQVNDVNGEDWYQQGDVLLFPKGGKKFKSKPIILT